MKDKVDPQVTLEPNYTPLITDGNQPKIIQPSIVNGYDGLTGVHDNLIWNPANGFMTYTLYNKVIYENTK